MSGRAPRAAEPTLPDDVLGWWRKWQGEKLYGNALAHHELVALISKREGEVAATKGALRARIEQHDAARELLREACDRLKFYDGRTTIKNHDKELIEAIDEVLKL